MFKHFLVTAIFLAAVANASLIGSTGVFPRRLLEDLESNIQRRQSSGSGSSIPLSDFPPQCQSGCTPAVNALNTCQTPTCLCTPTVDSSLQGCLDCVLQSSQAADLGSTAQQVVAAYNQGCAGSGISSISLAAGGATGSGSASASATGTDTATSSVGVATPTGVTTVPTVTSTPTVVPATTTASAPSTTTSKASGASATSASVGLLTIVVTFLAAFMA